MASKGEQIKIDSNYLRGTLAESILDPVTGALEEDDQKLIKFHGTYQQDDRDRREERAEKKLESLFTFMIRLRIPSGKTSAEQWVGINEIAEENSTGIIKITTRQTVQLHGIIKSKLKPTIAWFDKYNLDSIAACGDVNRNVIATTTPATTPGHDEVYEYSKQISEHLLPVTNAYNEIWLDGEKINGRQEEPLYGKTYLPRKFKIAIAIPPDNDVDAYAHDIGLIAIIENGALQGFNVLIGGGMGNTHSNDKTYPRTGDLIGYAPKEKILDVVYKIVSVQRDHGSREERAVARFKYTIDRLGLDFITSVLTHRLGYELEKPRSFELKTRADYYGWSEDYKGKHHYTLFVENGRILDCKEYQLKKALLEIAKSGKADFRFTANQNVIIGNVDSKDRDAVWAMLKKYNINNDDISNLRINSIACVALNTCPLAMAEGQRYMPILISKIEPILGKHKLDKDIISIRMTGCPNGCARPYLAEIGLVGKSLGSYNMYLGASAIGDRVNTLYKENMDEQAILTELDQLFGFYAKERKVNESFGDFSVRKIINN